MTEDQLAKEITKIADQETEQLRKDALYAMKMGDKYIWADTSRITVIIGLLYSYRRVIREAAEFLERFPSQTALLMKQPEMMALKDVK